jgi:rhamnose transport system permease protein
MKEARELPKARAPFRVWGLLLRWEWILLPLLALVMLLNGRLSEFFWDPYNLGDATFNFSEKGIMAITMALLILTREIDLSVSSIVALCSLCMGLVAGRGAELPVLVLVSLLVGTLAGFLNGFLVIRFAVPSIAITLGTMSLYRGISQAILGDQALTQYPQSLANLGQGYLLEPIPIAFVVFLLLALLVGVVLHCSRWGRQLYAIGNNPEAAKFSGIPVERYKLILFTLSGTFAGLAAAFLTGRISSTRPNIAQGWELDVITMVVLGGISIAGGTGSMLGVVLAVLLLGMISFGLALLNVPGIVANIFIGALLIGAIALPPLLKKLLKLGRK